MIDIRLKTGIIIRVGSEYVVGIQMGTGNLVLSVSPWDAWRTRIRANARSVARKLNGKMILFNPVAGQIKEMDVEA